MPVSGINSEIFATSRRTAKVLYVMRPSPLARDASNPVPDPLCEFLAKSAIADVYSNAGTAKEHRMRVVLSIIDTRFYANVNIRELLASAIEFL